MLLHRYALTDILRNLTQIFKSLRFSVIHACIVLVFTGAACQNVKSFCHSADITCNYLAFFLHSIDIDPGFQLPDSGQFTCSSGVSADGVMAACPQAIFGQDGDYPNKPHAWTLLITDNGETITDTISDLIWQRCSKGQSGSGCSGVASSAETQTTAQAYCAGLTLANRTWRVPTIREMLLFGDYGRDSPAADDNDVAAYYPNHPTGSALYWTSTPYVPTPGNYWYIDTQRGLSGEQVGTNTGYIRCVSESAPEPVFVDKGNGTVQDLSSGLLWTKCSMDNTGTGTLLPHASSCAGTTGTRMFPEALSDCENLVHAGRSDWRLPSIREYAYLLKFDAPAAPFIDSTVFPNTGAFPHWSSTTALVNVIIAWRIGFADAKIEALSFKSVNMRVRCVTDTN